MSDSGENGKAEELSKAIRLREKRRSRWLREGERPIWKNLSMIGSLGWLVVAPTLLGVFVGRLLDRVFGQGIFWTSALIFLGITIGSYLAWQKVQRE